MLKTISPAATRLCLGLAALVLAACAPADQGPSLPPVAMPNTVAEQVP